MNKGVNTLVVDDEEGVRFFLEETLRKAGHVVTTAENGEEALARLRDNPYDVILLDLRLGGRTDGLRVLEAVRWRWPDTVVVILTAHGSLESAMTAIREGVDGYLLKPVDPEDVRRAVADAIERRRNQGRTPQETQEPQTLQYGAFAVDLEKHMVLIEERDLELTPHEFKLLVHLMQNAHRVLSPSELVRVVRDYECDDLYEAQQVIKWYIHRLRRKVEQDPSNPRYILNVRGVGYRFEE